MATPTFHAELDALTDLVADVTGTATEIATGTYEWGAGTKSNIVAGSGIRWPSRAGIWTDPNNWTVVIVAKPDSTRSGTEPSSVFTLADSGGSYLLVSFHGDYASAASPAECFAAIHYKSGSFRRGGFSTVDVCDGVDHVYIARRTGATFEEFVDGTLVSTTTITVGTATLTGTSTTASLHCSGTFGTSGQVNRQAPLGMVKFYNEAITNEELASLSSDPFEAGGGSTDAAADGVTLTGAATLTPGTATGGSGAVDSTAEGVTLTGTATLTPGTATGGASGSFVSSPMYSSGILQTSVSLDWTWYPGAIGAAPTAALVHGSGATAGDGTLTMPGLPAGAGFYLAEGLDLNGEVLVALEYGTVT